MLGLNTRNLQAKLGETGHREPVVIFIPSDFDLHPDYPEYISKLGVHIRYPYTKFGEETY